MLVTCCGRLIDRDAEIVFIFNHFKKAAFHERSQLFSYGRPSNSRSLSELCRCEKMVVRKRTCVEGEAAAGGVVSPISSEIIYDSIIPACHDF